MKPLFKNKKKDLNLNSVLDDTDMFSNINLIHLKPLQIFLWKTMINGSVNLATVP